MKKTTTLPKTRSHAQKPASKTVTAPVFKFSKSRLETFSDGVIAIIITIMVLNIPLPDQFDLAQILGLLKSIFIFFASFFIVGSHWSSHHIVFEKVQVVSNTLIWRNLLFLFSLSLIPIFTKWVMQHPAEVVPALGYDIVYLLVAVSYQFMWSSVVGYKKPQGLNRVRQGGRARLLIKRWGIMIIAFTATIALTFFYPRFSLIVFIGFPLVFSLLNLVFEREPGPRSPEGAHLQKQPAR